MDCVVKEQVVETATLFFIAYILLLIKFMKTKRGYNHNMTVDTSRR